LQRIHPVEYRRERERGEGDTLTTAKIGGGYGSIRPDDERRIAADTSGDSLRIEQEQRHGERAKIGRGSCSGTRSSFKNVQGAGGEKRGIVGSAGVLRLLSREAVGEVGDEADA